MERAAKCGGIKRSKSGGGGRRLLGAPAPDGVDQTSDTDSLLERFVSLDYLLRDKIEEAEQEVLVGKDGKVIDRGEFCG